LKSTPAGWWKPPQVCNIDEPTYENHHDQISEVKMLNWNDEPNTQATLQGLAYLTTSDQTGAQLEW